MHAALDRREIAVAQFSLIRSSSSSAIIVKIPIAKRPIGVDPSNPSSTETNRAPAAFSRRIDSSASTAERANRSKLRDHDPARLAPLTAAERLLEHRPLELGARLVDLLPPLDDLDPRAFAQLAIRSRCTSGEINDSPSRPRPTAHPDVPVRNTETEVMTTSLQRCLAVVKHLDGYRIELIERSDY